MTEEITALLPGFRRTLTNKKLRPRTIVGYLNDLEHFVTWWQVRHGALPCLTDITAAEGRAYRHQLHHEAGLSAATVNRRLASLRIFLTWAVETDRIPTNPVTRIRGLKPPARIAPRWLSHWEQEQLTAAIERSVQLAMSLADHPETGLTIQALRDRALLILLLNTGLRVLEVTALTLDDLTLTDYEGAVFIREGKGGVPRTVPLNQRTRQVLDEYLALRPEHRSHRLFVGQRGPIGVRQVLRLLKKYCRHAGLEANLISVHTLRHTFGKNLVEAGVSLEEVAALMGHASLNTTRIYTIPDQLNLQRAVERLESGTIKDEMAI